jgi:hypothetical protein
MMIIVRGINWSRNTSLGIATGYGLDSQWSIPGRGKRLFSSPQRPDRLWDTSSLMSSEYWWILSRE